MTEEQLKEIEGRFLIHNDINAPTLIKEVIRDVRDDIPDLIQECRSRGDQIRNLRLALADLVYLAKDTRGSINSSCTLKWDCHCAICLAENALAMTRR